MARRRARRPDERSTDDVLTAARAVAERPGAFVISGGDPLGRGDLDDLLAELAGLRPDTLGLWTSGQASTARRCSASAAPASSA